MRIAASMQPEQGDFRKMIQVPAPIHNQGEERDGVKADEKKSNLDTSGERWPVGAPPRRSTEEPEGEREGHTISADIPSAAPSGNAAPSLAPDSGLRSALSPTSEPIPIEETDQGDDQEEDEG